MAKAAYTGPAAKLALYEKMVALNPDVQRKGAANPYTSLNGNMFTFLTKEGVVCLRMGEGERKAFVAKYRTKPVVQHGAVMREYVAVPAGLLQKSGELKRWFETSCAHAAGLEAKPTTRKKTPRKKGSATKAVKQKAAKKKKAARKRAR